MLSAKQVDIIHALSRALPPTRRGGNSTITRVTWGGFDVAVKDYAARSDSQDRMRREISAVKFLELQRICGVPKCLGVLRQSSICMFTWLPGDTPHASPSSVYAMLNMLESLHSASAARAANKLDAAADAMDSFQDVRNQILQRCESLSHSTIGSVAAVSQEIAAVASQKVISVESGQRVRTLSPSDFGLHNMLRNSKTHQYMFLDFEFFGWDDAHKLVIDTLLHPLASWPEHLALSFLQKSKEIYSLSESRLVSLAPLLSAKWATIVAARAERQAVAGDFVASNISLARAQTYLTKALDESESNWFSTTSVRETV